MKRMSHPGRLHNETTPTTAFGQYLRAARKQQRLTLATVATLACIHETTLSQIELGKMLPGTDLITRLAQALGIDEDELLTLSGRQTKTHDTKGKHVISTSETPSETPEEHPIHAIKRCPSCGETDSSQFGTDNSRPDKLRGSCKKCHNQRNLATYYRHREERKAYQRVYSQTHYEVHYEKKIAYKREWQRSHPEKSRLYNQRYRAKHRLPDETYHQMIDLARGEA